MEKIQIGDIAKINYTAMLISGEIVDTSYEEVARFAKIYDSDRDYTPITVEIGMAQVIEGVEKALVGMEKGEEKRILVPPEEGYGIRRSDLIQQIPLEVFEESDIEPIEGMIINTEKGPAQIVTISKDFVEVDFNHPLAGVTLVFEIKVEDVEKKGIDANKLYERGMSFFKLGEYENAIEFFDRALEIDSNFKLALNNKGACLIMLGRFDEAVKCYNQLLELSPDHVLALSNKGFCLTKLGKYEEAIELFDRILEIDPNNYLAWINRGTTLTSMNMLEEAIECYEKALGINPKSKEAKEAKERILKKMGK
ncbi:MAG: tetratricopeptide repeat protein [Candidatus Hydrothermarchaeota archaeon]